MRSRLTQSHSAPAPASVRGIATELLREQEQFWEETNTPFIGRNSPLGIADGKITYTKSTVLANKNNNKNIPWTSIQPEMACHPGQCASLEKKDNLKATYLLGNGEVTRTSLCPHSCLLYWKCPPYSLAASVATKGWHRPHPLGHG